MTMMEENEYEALKKVVNHYIENERKHFEESLTIDEWHIVHNGGMIQTDHIFHSLQLLDNFIKRMEDEGPREY